MIYHVMYFHINDMKIFQLFIEKFLSCRVVNNVSYFHERNQITLSGENWIISRTPSHEILHNCSILKQDWQITLSNSSNSRDDFLFHVLQKYLWYPGENIFYCLCLFISTWERILRRGPNESFSSVRLSAIISQKDTNEN